MTVSHTRAQTAGRSEYAQWNLTSADGTGNAYSAPGAADRSVQVAGDLGGGTVIIEGSNEATPVNWATLHAPDGAALEFTNAGIEALLENTLHIRPRLSGGALGDCTVIIFSRSTL